MHLTKNTGRPDSSTCTDPNYISNPFLGVGGDSHCNSMSSTFTTLSWSIFCIPHLARPTVGGPARRVGSYPAGSSLFSLCVSAVKGWVWRLHCCSFSISCKFCNLFSMIYILMWFLCRRYRIIVDSFPLGHLFVPSRLVFSALWTLLFDVLRLFPTMALDPFFSDLIERANEAQYIGRGMGLVIVPSCLLYGLVTNHNKFTISTLRFLSWGYSLVLSGLKILASWW